MILQAGLARAMFIMAEAQQLSLEHCGDSVQQGHWRHGRHANQPSLIACVSYQVIMLRCQAHTPVGIAKAWSRA
jgi:hypothetical protein